MKIKLTCKTIIDTKEIKRLRDKPVRLYISFGKEEKVDYSIEWNDGTFTEITKQEYKRLKKIVGDENEYGKDI